MVEPIRLELATLTLGEISKAELASGLAVSDMARSPATLRLLALFVHELRTSDAPRNWSELSSLKVLDGSSLTLPTPRGGRSRTSKA